MVTLQFGEGKIGVHFYSCLLEEGMVRGIAFTEHEETHPMGLASPYNGQSLEDLNSKVVFEFANAASVDVVIEMLEELKTRILGLGE